MNCYSENFQGFILMKNALNNQVGLLGDMFLWLVANLKQGVIYFIKQACGNDIWAAVYLLNFTTFLPFLKKMFDKKQKNYGFCKISYLDSTLNKTNHIAWTFLAFLSKVVSNNLDGSDADKCHSELKDVDRVISHKFHKPWHVLKVKPKWWKPENI